MTLRQVYAGDEREQRYRSIGSEVDSGTPKIVTGRPAVTLTATGGFTKNYTLPSGETITYNAGGVGNAPKYAVVAFSGTYEFPVDGASASTAQDTEVFIGSDGALTLTGTDNTHFGWVDYPQDYKASAEFTPVRIGA